MLCFLFCLTLVCINNKNCLIDLYRGNLLSTIILYARYTSSHKTDWIYTDPIACFPFPFISQSKQSDVCSWMRMFSRSRNMCKCEYHYFIVICIFCYIYSNNVYCCFLFPCLLLFFFFTEVIPIFLFIRWLCKQVRCF